MTWIADATVMHHELRPNTPRHPDNDDTNTDRPRHKLLRKAKPINTNGHTLQQTYPGWQCIKCMKQSKTATAQHTITRKPCKGNPLIAIANDDTDDEIDADADPRNFRGHQLWYADPIIICLKCGAYTQKHLRHLKYTCQPPGPKDFGTTAIKRARQCRHPQRHTTPIGRPVPLPKPRLQALAHIQTLAPPTTHPPTLYFIL